MTEMDAAQGIEVGVLRQIVPNVLQGGDAYKREYPFLLCPKKVVEFVFWSQSGTVPIVILASWVRNL